MRIHVIWPILSLVVTLVLFLMLLYEHSWIPDYAEAEPLYPVAAEFGHALKESRSDEPLSVEKIIDLLSEERFDRIQPYGIIFSDDPKTIVTIRINKTYSFEIQSDGRPMWK